MVLLLGPEDALVQRRVDKDIEHVFLVAQHIVGAASHDDAGPLGGHLPDHIGLGDEHLVAHRQVLCAHVEIVEKAAGLFLLGLTDELLREAGLLGRQIDDGLVVEGNVQGLSHPLGHNAPAGAELAADGENGMRHNYYLLVVGRKERIF